MAEIIIPILTLIIGMFVGANNHSRLNPFRRLLENRAKKELDEQLGKAKEKLREIL